MNNPMLVFKTSDVNEAVEIFKSLFDESVLDEDSKYAIRCLLPESDKDYIKNSIVQNKTWSTNADGNVWVEIGKDVKIQRLMHKKKSHSKVVIISGIDVVRKTKKHNMKSEI